VTAAGNGWTIRSVTVWRSTRPPAWCAQLGIGAAEALARMRAHAFVEQRLLIDVARDVVLRQLRFTENMS
jgi:hypothetical protein